MSTVNMCSTDFINLQENNQDEKDVQCNVYDMAGNVAEFSTEASNLEGYPCVDRGGCVQSGYYGMAEDRDAEIDGNRIR